MAAEALDIAIPLPIDLRRIGRHPTELSHVRRNLEIAPTTRRMRRRRGQRNGMRLPGSGTRASACLFGKALLRWPCRSYWRWSLCRVTGETDTTPVGATAKVTQLAFSALTPDNVNVNLMRPISRWVRRLQWPTCSPNHPGVPGPRIRAHQVAEILFSD
jgi:hypothetical protein